MYANFLRPAMEPQTTTSRAQWPESSFEYSGHKLWQAAYYLTAPATAIPPAEAIRQMLRFPSHTPREAFEAYQRLNSLNTAEGLCPSAAFRRDPLRVLEDDRAKLTQAFESYETYRRRIDDAPVPPGAWNHDRQNMYGMVRWMWYYQGRVELGEQAQITKRFHVNEQMAFEF